MILKNIQINNLLDLLYSEKLEGKSARLRKRFKGYCEDRLREMNEEYLVLLAKHTTDNIHLIDAKIFDEDYNALMAEEFVLDETEERKETLLGIKNILENFKLELDGNPALLWDEMIDIFDKIYGGIQ